MHRTAEMTVATPWRIPRVSRLYGGRQQGLLGSVVHFRRQVIEAALESNLRLVDDRQLSSADWVLCDGYPECHEAISNRSDHQRLLICAGGALPRGCEPLSTSLRSNLRTTDVLLVNCAADLVNAHRLFGGEAGLQIVKAPIPVQGHWSEALTARHDPNAELTLVYHGRVNRQKNVDLAITCLSLLRSFGWSSRLIVIGDEDSMPHEEFGLDNAGYLDECKERQADLGLSGKVDWWGSQSPEAVQRIVQGADVAINLSTYNREN
jgi:glycosyltransferase involved in cell wall biosynthesis